MGAGVSIFLLLLCLWKKYRGNLLTRTCTHILSTGYDGNDEYDMTTLCTF